MNKYLEQLRSCGGYYECPRDEDGKRLGPLVGYAGKYQNRNGEKKQFVGDVYYNLAKIEESPRVLDYFAEECAVMIAAKITCIDYVLGAPMGGIAFASALAKYLDCRFVFAEKKTTALATSESREKSKFLMKRHVIKPRSKVVIVEDVCNNFSTTGDLRVLIEECKGVLAGIACELNRSNGKTWQKLPVVSLIYQPTKQYSQDDIRVRDDVQDGNVVWKPKDEWDRLQAIMAAHL